MLIIVFRYGQMTAGSYCYIGPQGIVHGTTVRGLCDVCVSLCALFSANYGDPTSVFELSVCLHVNQSLFPSLPRPLPIPFLPLSPSLLSFSLSLPLCIFISSYSFHYRIDMLLFPVIRLMSVVGVHQLS